MNIHEAKQEARKERLERAATRAAGTAQSLASRAHQMASAIPFGQPILVGHHSEKRDRNYRGRINATFARAAAESTRAKELAARAAAVGTAGVSSDDPEAVQKLDVEIARREQNQARMKAVNVEIRKGGADVEVRLIAMGMSAIEADRIVRPNCVGDVGYAAYQLTNNSAEIRRLQKRVAALRASYAAPARAAIEGAGWRIFEERDDNRVCVTHDEKPPAEVRARLKSWGFKWSPTRLAWVRMLNNAAWHAACAAMGYEAPRVEDAIYAGDDATARLSAYAAAKGLDWTIALISEPEGRPAYRLTRDRDHAIEPPQVIGETEGQARETIEITVATGKGARK